jgi:hypothetical protein
VTSASRVPARPAYDDGHTGAGRAGIRSSQEDNTMSDGCQCHHGGAGGAAPHLTTIGLGERGAIGPETTVEAASRRSGRALETLQGFGFDTCCGGRLTLAEASAAAGLPVETVLRALRELER